MNIHYYRQIRMIGYERIMEGDEVVIFEWRIKKIATSNLKKYN